MASAGDYAERLARHARYVNAPYVRFLERLGLDLDIVRAVGAAVTDASGRRYVDCIAGYGNLNVGHNDPRVIGAAVAELTSSHPYNLPFLSDAESRLAERLAVVAPGDAECSLIVSSGSEAVDSALKLARLATGKAGVIAAHGAWHGFTVGALSVSEPAMRRGFDPLLPGVAHVPYGDATAVAEAIDGQTGAVLIEPIQAESGAVVPPDGYLRELAATCEEHGVVFVLDEIKTGIGKTGRLFDCEHEGVTPDVLLCGKSLGGGAMPIGALVARRPLFAKVGLSFPMSASSAAGNAPACAAALATLDVVRSDDLCGRAATSGALILETLRELAAEATPLVTGASGRGLLLALHTDSLRTATEIVRACIRRGVLVANAFCDRTRILVEPPLCIADDDVETVRSALRESVREVARAA